MPITIIAVPIKSYLSGLKLSIFYDIKFEWVKGHSGNQFNERVDQLCTETRNKYLQTRP